MKRILTILGVVIALVALSIPVFAITQGGVADDGEHPFVGLMVAWGDVLEFDEFGEPIDQNDDGAIDDDDLVFSPLWRCSGTLISPTVYVTAGHCTESPATDAYIWFEEDVESGLPTEDPPDPGNGYPGPGGTSYHGYAYTHPLYNPAAFFLFDLGVVMLDGPGALMDEYATLPTEGAIDDMGKGRKRSVIEAVGYGGQDIRPVPVFERIRLKADLKVVNTNGVAGVGPFPTGEPFPSNSVLVSGDAKHGGTCFGDSGGPMFIGTEAPYVIGAVTSFGLNGNCAGVGGGFRIDRALELGWINSFLDGGGDG